MYARPRILSLITTHRCTAACDHCCFGCSPKVTKAIPVARLHSLIDEAAAIPSFEMVGFTGGECFLLGKHLDALIARATGHGLRTRVVTNGYWAVTALAARRRIEALRDAGLGEVHLSTGMFHARFVPVERVLQAARASAEAGLFTTVWIEECEGSTFDGAFVRAALDDLVRERRVYVGSQPWIENADGRGEARLEHDPALSRFRDENKSGCPSILEVLSVTPDQTLIACCGFTMESIPELHLGSVAERSLAEVLEGAPNELLKYWLHVEGPERILEFVQRFEPDYRLPAESPSMCQTCLHLHRDPVAQRVLAEHADDIPFEAIMNAFAERIGTRVVRATR
ncbi:MAG: radical SAM protein [Candidatus Eremiobacteraeota bacterium]|nr:radical SAM protein [Candidatus Eremiobacteraeota bacterium]